MARTISHEETGFPTYTTKSTWTVHPKSQAKSPESCAGDTDGEGTSGKESYRYRSTQSRANLRVPDLESAARNSTPKNPAWGCDRQFYPRRRQSTFLIDLNVYDTSRHWNLQLRSSFSPAQWSKPSQKRIFGPLLPLLALGCLFYLVCNED